MLKAPKGTRALKDIPAHKAILELKEILEHKELRDIPALKV